MARSLSTNKISMVMRGSMCPYCDSRETESNGYTEFRCDSCDHRWGREFKGADWYGIENVEAA